MNNIITQEEKNKIDALCKEYYIENYTINADGSIDVDGDVDIRNHGLKTLPLKFGKVTGEFDCSANILSSLVGCPREVGGDFFCNSNQLTSLIGCPDKVGGDFYCNGNKLTSLEACPTVGGSFLCYTNELTSLEHSPSEVGGRFYCSNNKLTSLEGCPTVGGDFNCNDNKFPDTFYYSFMDLSHYDQLIFIKYQHYFNVWTPDFNIDGMNELIGEIKDGLK
jgi:hypothetical protein